MADNTTKIEQSIHKLKLVVPPELLDFAFYSIADGVCTISRQMAATILAGLQLVKVRFLQETIKQQKTQQHRSFRSGLFSGEMESKCPLLLTVEIET